MSNLTAIVGALAFFTLPAMIYITNTNLENTTPDTFLSVTIEGEPKIKELLYQENPSYSQEAIKSWVKRSISPFYNYNANNYIDVMKSARNVLSEKTREEFIHAHAVRIKAIVANGYLITSSVVIGGPTLLQSGIVDGVEFHKYYVELSTVYKAEGKTLYKEPQLVVTVRLDDASKNANGISITDFYCKNC